MWSETGDQKGISLIELVVTIVIISLGAGVIYAYLEAVTRSPEPVLRSQAISLGAGLMEEVIAKRWDETTPLGGGNTTNPTPVGSLGPEPGETRQKFDDVDDYNGFSEVDSFTDQEGNVVTIKGARRSVTVDYIPDDSTHITEDSPAPSTTPTNTKRIVVKVKAPGEEEFTFVAVRCNY